jgi:hypothetical protein
MKTGVTSFEWLKVKTDKADPDLPHVTGLTGVV